MQDVARVVGAIISLVIFLACIAGLVFSVVIQSPIMIVVTLLLTAGFGFFVYVDYLKFFVNKPTK